MFGIAMYSSCIMIHDSYTKWDQSPGNKWTVETGNLISDYYLDLIT